MSEEYEICQRRGHEPAEGKTLMLASNPPIPQHVCKWCGTRYTVRTTTETVVAEAEPKAQNTPDSALGCGFGGGG